MKVSCNRDCFNCKQLDCINSIITPEERKLSNDLDKDLCGDVIDPKVLRLRKNKLRCYYKHKGEPDHIKKRQEYREENREYLRELSQEYYKKNREDINARNLANYYLNHEENKAKNRERRKKSWHENIEVNRQKQRDYRARKREERKMLENEHNKNVSAGVT